MAALDKKILKDVSRSFYLSMCVLPKPMRDPVSLGYLLARASDTLADTEALDAGLRLDMLHGMRAVLNGGKRGEWLQRLKREVIPCQSHEGEIILLEHMDEVFAWLQSLDSKPLREAIMTVMGHILRGQQLDIEQFELQQNFRFTQDAQLDEYCYLVAGCVGEFWSEVGSLTMSGFSSVDVDRLKDWGANYGKGLQLINILRDLPNDLKAGRCYLPQADPDDVDSLMSESQRWRDQARSYLKDGASYAQTLAGRRVRMATALPGMIGMRTLDLMDAADWEQLSQGVKVKRSEVYDCAWQAFVL